MRFDATEVQYNMKMERYNSHFLLSLLGRNEKQNTVASYIPACLRDSGGTITPQRETRNGAFGA